MKEGRQSCGLLEARACQTKGMACACEDHETRTSWTHPRYKKAKMRRAEWGRSDEREEEGSEASRRAQQTMHGWDFVLKGGRKSMKMLCEILFGFHLVKIGHWRDKREARRSISDYCPCHRDIDGGGLGEKWLDLEYIWDVQPTGIANWSDVSCWDREEL